MKTPRKQENKFICEECKKLCKNFQALKRHVNFKHNKKEYYDKWLKNEDDGICKICKKETKFHYDKSGYYDNCCSKECSKKYNLLRTKEEVFKKYGVENVYQLKSIQQKIKQTILERYGVEFILQNEKIKTIANEKRKKTNLIRYGSENILNNSKKREETCLEKYGVKNPVQNPEIWEKIKQTNLQKYGVEFPNQNKEIFDKGFKTRIQTKIYKDTILTYQSSYELDFLNNFYEKIDIENGLSIKYTFNGMDRIYHSDFYIPSLNLIVEIKNSYLAKKDNKEIKFKQTAVITKGYNYIIIIDKHYKKFNNLIKIT